ncbi:MAG: histidinol-phosphate transaminase [Eubacterium sp.]|nr:histidinol-phosphate transaminase [Eubacterium sp.]
MGKWENNVRKVVPYTPGEQPQQKNIIKLNTNENPYPPAPAVLSAFGRLTAEGLRRYPDPRAGRLTDALAAYYGVSPEQVFVGVGSDDVLAMAFQTFFNSSEPVLFPDITYSFYDVWAEAFRIPYKTIPLTERFEIRAEDYLIPNGGIVFPNPNAPTGTAITLEAVETILRGNPDVVVIVDEAYVDFGAESALPLIDQYENLLVVQTYSKSRSMAGARVGYAIGSSRLIAYLNAFKYSFNSYTMNDAAIILGAAALTDEDYFQETCRKIIETREWAKQEFSRLGFSFGDSCANFIFVTHAKVPARDIFAALRGRNIFVRYFDKPRIDNYLRVTIGTRAEMEQLFTALEEIIDGK